MGSAFRRWMGVLIGSAWTALPVWAQAYQETNPKPLEDKGMATEWLMAAAFLVGTLVVAFKPAKRSNLK